MVHDSKALEERAQFMGIAHCFIDIRPNGRGGRRMMIMSLFQGRPSRDISLVSSHLQMPIGCITYCCSVVQNLHMPLVFGKEVKHVPEQRTYSMLGREM
ncbi:hypothetical protein TELCIR_18528, partial [Teladorsagia circumcincta]